MPGGVFLIAGVATSIASPKRRWICWWRQIVEDDARAVSILSSWSDDVSGGRLQVEIKRARAPKRRSIGLQCDLDTADETCHCVGQLGFGASPEVPGGVDVRLQKRAAGVGGSSRRGVGEDRGNRGANISAARAVEKSYLPPGFHRGPASSHGCARWRYTTSKKHRKLKAL